MHNIMCKNDRKFCFYYTNLPSSSLCKESDLIIVITIPSASNHYTGDNDKILA